MKRSMASNDRKRWPFQRRLFGINKRWQLGDGGEAFLASGSIITFQIVHGNPNFLELKSEAFLEGRRKRRRRKVQLVHILQILVNSSLYVEVIKKTKKKKDPVR